MAMTLLPYVAGAQGGASGGVMELGVIGGLVLAGVVKAMLRYGWRRLRAPGGRHRQLAARIAGQRYPEGEG